MNTFFLIFTKNALLASSAWGIVWLTFLFLLCFLGVHIARLARLGWIYQKKPKKKAPNSPSSPQKQNEPKKEALAQSPQEPVYYIVERKQRRAKPNYSTPKEIRFKKDGNE